MALLDDEQTHPRMLLSRVHVRLGGRFFSVWWAIPILAGVGVVVVGRLEPTTKSPRSPMRWLSSMLI